MNPTINDMLPGTAVASMIRGGGTPGQIFQQNPMVENQLPGSAGYDPSLAQQAPSGQQAQPMMGQQMPPVAPNGQAAPQPQMSEAEMILKALSDRLEHHSKITQKTVSALTGMIEANQAIQNPPTA